MCHLASCTKMMSRLRRLVGEPSVRTDQSLDTHRTAACLSAQSHCMENAERVLLFPVCWQSTLELRPTSVLRMSCERCATPLYLCARARQVRLFGEACFSAAASAGSPTAVSCGASRAAAHASSIHFFNFSACSRRPSVRYA